MTPHPGGLSLGGGSRYFRAVLDSLLDAVVIADVHGVIWGYNEGARRLFGYAPGDVVGRPIGLLIPPACWRPDLAFFDRPSDDDSPPATRQHIEGRRKDGTRYCCQLDITGFAVDGQRYLVGVARDQADTSSPGGIARETLQDAV